MAAFVQVAALLWTGLSTDTKPTGVTIGTHCLEYDTDILSITYDGTNWVVQDNLVRLVAGTALIGKVGIDQVTANANEVVLKAGTAVIGKTLPARTVVETQFSATASMVVGTHKLAPGVAYKVVAIEIHNSAAPSTGTQNLVLTLDNGTGSAYDVTLLSLDMVANAITDLRLTPEELLCKATDVITASFLNSDAVTWGLTFKHEVTG